MAGRIPTPRLLPLTIATMAAVLCLHVTVLLRGTSDGAPAQPPALVAPAIAAPAPQPAPAKPPVPPKPAEAKASPAPEPPVLQDLRARSRELDARAAALDERERVLDAAEHKLQAQLQDLTALQKRLQAEDAERRARDEANWQGLVKLYEAMRPRQAATIFNDLDMPVLIQVLNRMKERKAAPILAAMQPERAREVTARLAALRTGTGDADQDCHDRGEPCRSTNP